MSDLPPDLAALLEAFDETEDRARALVAGLDEAQLNWQPGGGSAWSIAQCLDHLRAGKKAYLDALAPALERARERGATGSRPLRPSWPARRFIASLEPGSRMKARAPKATQPPSRIAIGDVLAPFLRVHGELTAVLRDAAGDIDLNRVILRNPFIGFIRMRAGSAFLIIAAHDRRHLAQARRVRDDPAFPAAE